jgi:hypothetical protein
MGGLAICDLRYTIDGGHDVISRSLKLNSLIYLWNIDKSGLRQAALQTIREILRRMETRASVWSAGL